MKQFIFRNKKALKGIGAALLIGAVTMSFQDSPVFHSQFDLEDVTDDTIPLRKDNSTMKMKDFDKLSEDLNNTLMEVGVEMKKIDFGQIQKEVEQTLKEINSKDILKEVELSLKSIDLEKMLADVKSSLKDIRWDEKKDEISLAMNEAKKQIENAAGEVRNIDRKSIEKALEETRSTLEKTKVEIGKIDMDKIMEDAKDGINKAKVELKETKTMFNEMEKDRLINSKEGFSIEYKEKDLYINGVKQADKVTDKYRKYFKRGHFKIHIEKE